MLRAVRAVTSAVVVNVGFVVCVCLCLLRICFSVQLEGDVAELETKLEATKVDVMRVEQQLQPIVDRLSTINHRYHEVYVVQTKIGMRRHLVKARNSDGIGYLIWSL